MKKTVFLSLLLSLFATSSVPLETGAQTPSDIMSEPGATPKPDLNPQGDPTLKTDSRVKIDTKLKTQQISKFDHAFASAEKESCKTTQTGAREAWLNQEMKKIDINDMTTQNITRQVWNTQALGLKIDGQTESAAWVPGSPGTSGSLLGVPFNSGNNHEKSAVEGSLIDVGRGTLAELSTTKNLDGNFWLVQVSKSLPDAGALALEAKSHKSLGLIIYGGAPALRVGTAGPVAAVPMMIITQDQAEKVKTKLKDAPVHVSFSLKTEFPSAESGHALLVRRGVRPQQVFIIAREENCEELGETLAFLKWLNETKVDCSGTTVAFLENSDFADPRNLEDWAHPAAAFNAATITSSKSEAQFLTTWFKADREPESNIDIKGVLKKAESLNSVLKGLVSAEALKKYQESLAAVKKNGISKPQIRVKLVQIYSQDPSALIADELRRLREIHTLAERGLYSQASAELKKIADFKWADNVSLETFLTYEHQKDSKDEAALDPNLWIASQKGKGNLDVLIEVLEKEIDRLDKVLSDNFFNLQKSIEEFINI